MTTRVHWQDLVRYAKRYGRYSRALGEAHLVNNTFQLVSEGLILNTSDQPLPRVILVTWVDGDTYMLFNAYTTDSVVWGIWHLDDELGFPVWVGWEEAG